MKTVILLSFLAILFATVALLRQRKGDRVVGVQEDDPKMTAATAEARRTLPQFWSAYERPEHGESRFSLKVRIADSNGSEHFWVGELRRENGRVSGRIDNAPAVVKSVKFGDRIDVQEQNISDWGYVRDGKMFGQYTLRAMLKCLPPDQIVKLRKALAPEESDGGAPPVGDWNVVSFGGHEMQNPSLRLVITDATMELVAPGRKRKLMGFITRVGTNTGPCQIDIAKDGFEGLGIFEVNGKHMKLVIANPGKPRPTQFKEEPDTSLFILNQ